MNILWIDNEQNASDDGLLRGLSVDRAGSESAALLLFQNKQFDAVIINGGADASTIGGLLTELRRSDPSTPILIRYQSPTLDDAVLLTKLGAFHILDTSADAAELHACLRAAVDHRRARRSPHPATVEPWRSDLVGRSHAMDHVIEMIRLVGPRRCTVLITGETGTGKELVARALHRASSRAQAGMVAVNCTALPDHLLEAELFGHVRGAFTGATNHRIGRFEQAHRSTLFLDEVADLPLELQAKLLRVLQEREFQRLGSSETIRVDVRVIAACNVNLMDRVRDGGFREDLYYRLNVVPIELPPLRERMDDVPLLADHFIERICSREMLPLKRLSNEALDRLTSHNWPGNVRQLENAIESAVVLSGDRDLLYASDFRLHRHASPVRTCATAPVIAVPDVGLDFERTVGQIERNILEQALKKTKGNKKQAADMLRLKRTTLAAKLKSLEALAV
jgi:DNA-binding NtrC family response regulator